MARVVVTGGSGFVGGHLVRCLLDRGDEVTVFDTGRVSAGRRCLPEEVRHVTGDIRDESALARAITPDVDVVYHLAALVGVQYYLHRPLDVIDINFHGTVNLLQAAERAGSKVVFASSSEVFGKNPAVPWAEDDDRVTGSTATNRWCYSTSKALAEHVTFGYVHQRGLRASIIRYFNLYGPWQRPAFLVSRSIHRALRGIPPVVYDGGHQTRSFTFIDDAVEATAAIGASEKSDGEAFNVGATQEVTIGQVVEHIADLAGLREPTEQLDTNTRYGNSYQDLQKRIPDTSKIHAILGWRATTGLRDGLRATVEWARRHPWWLDLPDNVNP
ncbi:GDP-mannose 4,6-dehydratase [Nonomuraea sp. MCN248]|uniref:GDP-mannose 4,6-dehydratase n=1 Tax=Nonomuraea corallina TaxID=2989783 RepID=A0ABT4SF23_9ACTN|nr:NAD-dependent epimerase/dehydratase family protein [Nonomuraea corallina]MDA0635764.1 GDP-mannose 4,6-dehydratase [Nonomuraea corallina]